MSDYEHHYGQFMIKCIACRKKEVVPRLHTCEDCPGILCDTCMHKAIVGFPLYSTPPADFEKVGGSVELCECHTQVQCVICERMDIPNNLCSGCDGPLCFTCAENGVYPKDLGTDKCIIDNCPRCPEGPEEPEEPEEPEGPEKPEEPEGPEGPEGL